MVIAGDFDPAEAKRLSRSTTATSRRARALDRPPVGPDAERENVIEVSDRVSLERGYMAWPSPAVLRRRTMRHWIWRRRVLADGLSSRLNKALVYDQQLATDVASFNATAEIAERVRRAGHGAAGRAAVEDRADRHGGDHAARKEGPTAEELERAKTKQESEFISGLERIGGFGGKADVLNQYNTFLGDPGQGRRGPAALSRADAGRHTARRRDAGSTRRTARSCASIPRPSKRPANAMTFDRSRCRRLAPTVRSSRRPCRRHARRTASTVIVVERHDLPKVNVTLVSKAGRGRRSGRQAGRRQPDDGDDRPGNADAQGARDRGRARRARARRSAAARDARAPR